MILALVWFGVASFLIWTVFVAERHYPRDVDVPICMVMALAWPIAVPIGIGAALIRGWIWLLYWLAQRVGGPR